MKRVTNPSDKDLARRVGDREYKIPSGKTIEAPDEHAQILAHGWAHHGVHIVGDNTPPAVSAAARVLATHHKEEEEPAPAPVPEPIPAGPESPVEVAQPEPEVPPAPVTAATESEPKSAPKSKKATSPPRSTRKRNKGGNS